MQAHRHQPDVTSRRGGRARPIRGAQARHGEKRAQDRGAVGASGKAREALLRDPRRVTARRRGAVAGEQDGGRGLGHGEVRGWVLLRRQGEEVHPDMPTRLFLRPGDQAMRLGRYQRQDDTVMDM